MKKNENETQNFEKEKKCKIFYSHLIIVHCSTRSHMGFMFIARQSIYVFSEEV